MLAFGHHKWKFLSTILVSRKKCLRHHDPWRLKDTVTRNFSSKLTSDAAQRTRRPKTLRNWRPERNSSYQTWWLVGRRQQVEILPWYSERFRSTDPLKWRSHIFLWKFSTGQHIPDYTLQGVSHHHRLGSLNVERCCLFSEWNYSRPFCVAISCHR